MTTSNQVPKDYYQNKIAESEHHLQKLTHRKSSFGWLRLGAIAVLILALYLLSHAGMIYVILAIIFLIAVFLRLVMADLKNQDAISHTQRLIQNYKNEIESLEGRPVFEDGSEYMEKEHPYAHDLDIFGKASVFQFLNRTTTEPGQQLLANSLKKSANPEEILQRQEAVKELAEKIDWIHELRAIGEKNKVTVGGCNRLFKWIEEPPIFSPFKPWKWLRYLLPAIILAIVILYFTNIVGLGILYGGLLLFAVLAWQIHKVVAPIHSSLTNITAELGTLAETLKSIENQPFKNNFLCDLQAACIVSGSPASGSIRKLKKLTNNLDLRYNFVLSLPLNILLLWNLQQMLDLEKWKAVHQQVLEKWIHTLSHIEVLNSFAVIRYNYPDWSFAELSDSYFYIEGKDVGHPLIPEEKRVCNPVQIDSKGKLMLVTGSNMAGKSTYLRSVGVNTVLAMAGAPVCATYFKISPVALISSMRVTDNLEESTSTFYAELKKLKMIIDLVNHKEEIFILLDEILRGTNSVDRHTGSKALIKQLIEKKSVGIVATHDLELARQQESFADHILNYHFDVQVSGEELYFDYQLKPGICTSLNASILMKKIGIDI